MLKLGGSEGEWTLYDVANELWVGKNTSSTTNFVRSSDENSLSNTNYTWTIKKLNEEYAIYTNVSNYNTRCWGRNNSSIGPYADSSYPACVLYKKVTAKTNPTISFTNGSVRVGQTLDLSTLWTSNSSGDVTYSITAGGSYATLSGSALTGTAEGSVTVKAEQAAAGTYNAGEATATITVNAALALSSIAITTAPTKTTYNEGETFDATGMVVTATYEDESTDDVTSQCNWTPSGALATSDTEITVSYTENNVTKTATQAITVNEYIQPNPVTIQMTNSLFGQEVYNSNTKSTKEMTFVGTQDGVTVTYYVPKDSYYYFNTSNTRPYNTCTLDYAAPTGYAITKIVFTSDGNNWNDATCSAGAMSTTNNKEWNGFANNVTFSWATSGTRIKTVVVTLANQATVSISAAKYATFASDAKLDFSEVSGLYVYTATVNESTVTFTKVTGSVKAGEGLLLYADVNTATEFSVPVATDSPSAVAGNKLVRGTGEAVASENGNGGRNYILSNNNNVIDFYLANDKVVPASKAYLKDIPTTAAKIAIPFGDGETTKINLNVNDNLNFDENAPRYNMAGQRVSESYKGIVIVNGKKYINK